MTKKQCPKIVGFFPIANGSSGRLPRYSIVCKYGQQTVVGRNRRTFVSFVFTYVKTEPVYLSIGDRHY